MENWKNKVIVALSGGVDSAVSALLLKEQGYHVEAIHVKSWDAYGNNDKEGVSLDCIQGNDFQVAQQVANFLEIKLHKLDLVKEYWVNVFNPSLKELIKGNTPNPDIFCNKFIKFGYLKKYVTENFKNYYFATGHYAKLNHEKNELWMAKDSFKDQTYFLAKVKTSQFKNVLFPLANLMKTKVRRIAKEKGLVNYNKKDSTGLCFIGERSYAEFLENYIQSHIGKIINLYTKEVIGKHKGYEFFSLGQNKALNLGGQKERMCVVKKDIKNNILYVAPINDKINFKNKFFISSVNWIGKISSQDKEGELFIRIRHQGNLNLGKLNLKNNKVVLNKKIKGITSGQEAVFYKNKRCLGGATIKEVI